MLQRLVLLLLILTTPLGLKLVAAPAEEVDFPIVAWNQMDPKNPWMGYFNDPNQFSIMKECGINSVCAIGPEFLEAYAKSGMKKAWLLDPKMIAMYNRIVFEKVFPTDQEIESMVEGMVKAYDHHPSVYGYYVVDEPAGSLFPVIGKIAAAIQKRSKKPYYANLLPTYASAVTQLETKTYEEHVLGFIEKCKPPFLSYDHYAFGDEGGVRAGYWENMNIIYGIAKQKKLPVIPIVMTSTSGTLREVTEADLLFQVFTHLAYGAKGMQYFTYFAPLIGSYRGTPIDQFGAKNPIWYYMQRVNRRIKVLAPILAKLQWEKSYHFGNAIPMEKGVNAANDESLLKGIKNYDGSVPSVLVGELKDQAGKDYLMIVNKDLKKAISVEFTFKTAPKAILECSRWNGIDFPWSGENAWLAPGEGVLIHFQ